MSRRPWALPRFIGGPRIPAKPPVMMWHKTRPQLARTRDRARCVVPNAVPFSLTGVTGYIHRPDMQSIHHKRALFMASWTTAAILILSGHAIDAQPLEVGTYDVFAEDGSFTTETPPELLVRPLEFVPITVEGEVISNGQGHQIHPLTEVMPLPVRPITGPRRGVRNIQPDGEGKVWFEVAHPEQSFVSFDGTVWEEIDNSITGDIRVLGMGSDREGAIWIYGNDVVWRILDEELTIFHLDVSIRAFASSADGVWMGGSRLRGQAVVYHYEGQQWTEFDQSDGLPEFGVSCIAVDSTDTIWVGISYYASSYPHPEYDPPLLSFDGERWTAYELDLMRYDDGGPRHFFVDSTGQLWFSSYSRLFLRSDQGWLHHEQKSWWTTHSMAEGSDGRIWLAGDLEIGFIKDRTWYYYGNESPEPGDPEPIFGAQAQELSIDENGVIWTGIWWPIRWRQSPIPTIIEGQNPDGQSYYFKLDDNSPNPFNPSTSIRYQLKDAGPVSLRVYDITGQLVRSLVENEQPAGHYSVSWDGLNSAGVRAASGVYLYELRAGSFQSTRKMLLVN
jgi:hypothetical protein